MQSQIPVPTDNIYKFYALFSLLLLVFSFSAVLYVGTAANEVILANIVEVETLKQEKSPTVTQQVRRAALERRMEIATSDRRFFLVVLALLIVGSCWGIFYGFKKWHTQIQPVLDATACTPLELVQVELETARAKLAKLHSGATDDDT